MNVVDSANVMLRYTSDVMAPVSMNSGAFTVCTPSSRSPMVVIVPWAAPMMPSSMYRAKYFSEAVRSRPSRPSSSTSTLKITTKANAPTHRARLVMSGAIPEP